MKTFAQWVIALTRGYIKATGKKPDKLAKLKINMEAGQKVKDQNKVIEFPGDKITDWTKPRPGEAKVGELQSGIMKATGSKPKVVKTTGMADKDFKNLHRSFKLNLAKNSREFNEDIANRIIKRELYTDVSDAQRKLLLDNLTSVLKEPLAYGGIAGMLGE
jgi:predicted metal-dependent RNase